MKRKLADEFPDDQFFIDGYNVPSYRRDRNQHEGGLMVFSRKDLITKRLSDYEDSSVEMICIELTVARKRGIFL